MKTQKLLLAFSEVLTIYCLIIVGYGILALCNSDMVWRLALSFPSFIAWKYGNLGKEKAN